MNPNRFAAVRELFERVIDLPESEREPLLRGETADAGMAAEVLALCRVADGNSTTSYASPVSAMLEITATSALKPGDTLGAWRIVREIGAGGMGSVFLVERTDGHYRQTAALKFVKGMPRAETLAYFTRERQTLASLAHPNIARLIDGGATSGGQPYLVMEYVDGIPIDRYCLERALDVPRILDLFAQACAAVSFAHRQLVVHCDLKPANLLVDRDARPVLLDFGIARLLDQVAQTDGTPNHPSPPGSPGPAGTTADSQREPSNTPHTPRYASPEQRERGMVSTASDIYSLGVVLRELLDKHIASHAAGAPLRDRELLAIVGGATAADPARRYASVDALVDDLRRFQAHEPVLAMPEAPLYPARKWLSRRWPVAVAAMAFAVMVIGFTAKVIVESQRAQSAEREALVERDSARAARGEAERERDRATAAEAATREQRNVAVAAQTAATTERDRARQSEQRAVTERNRATQAEGSARQTAEFMVSVFDSSNPNAESADIPASKLIAAAETRLKRDLAGQAGTQAELYSALARVQQNMGHSKEAVANFKRAIELERKQGRPLVLAQMLARFAFIDQDTFSGKEAPALSSEALALRRKHAAPDSEELAESLALQGHVLMFGRGKLDEAGELLAQSLAIRAKRDPESAGTAQSLWYVGQWEGKMSRYGKAIDYQQRALSLREKIHGAGHPECLNVQEDLATNLRLAARLEEAERIQRAALAAREKLHGRNSEQTLRQIVLLARLVGARGRTKESLALNQEALAIAEKTNGTESIQYAVILNNIALGQRSLGLTAEALGSMERVMPLYRKLYPAANPSRAVVEKNWGTTLLAAGRHEEAYAALQNAYDLNLRVHGPQHHEPADVLVQTALAAVELGRLDDADARLAQAKASPAIEKSPVLRAQYLFATGLAAAKRGNVEDALASLENAEALLTSQSDGQMARWHIVARRAELLAARNRGDDKAKSRELAERFLGPGGAPFEPEAPIAKRMRALR